jgi:hypothetical protein
MAVEGKMEVTLKIEELPIGRPAAHGWTEFSVLADGQEIKMSVRPKVWTKLNQAQADWPSWVATITGRMGPRTAKGFTMLEPAVQTFERKTKPAPTSENSPQETLVSA